MSGILALARLNLLLFARSQRFVPPLIAYVLVVGLLFSPPVDPVSSVYGVAAAALYPLSAWIATLVVGSETGGQRQVATTAIGSLASAWAARLSAVATVVWGLALVTVVIPAVAGVFTGPPTSGELVTALAAALFTSTGGALVGVLCSAPFIASVGWRVVVCGGLLVASVPIADAGPARFLLPPSIAVARLLDGTAPSSAADWLSPVAAPFVCASTLGALLLVALVRRRT